MPDPAIIPVGATADGKAVAMLGRMSNRHGLIAGATGTGKSVTLQALAQGFSALGVPVFTADVKGDLAGLALPGEASPRIAERLAAIKAGPFEPEASPVVFWDLLGKKGHPIRTTISEMGPVLLGRLMDLNDVQQGVLEIAFRIADEQKMLLLDMKDLRSMLTAMSEHASDLLATHGNISKTSVGALQRKLASL